MIQEKSLQFVSQFNLGRRERVREREEREREREKEEE